MRFQTVLLAAVAAFGSTAFAQSSSESSASSSSSVSASSSSSSSASESSASSSSSSASASRSSSVSSSASVTSAAASSSSASSSSSSDDEEPTSTRVYTTTYYYITENPTHAAQSPTLLIESVVKSTSGQSDQQSFSTPTGRVTVLDVKKSTYTTTYTSENHIHAAQSQYFTVTAVVTTTDGLPNTSSTSDNAAGRRGVKEVGGLAAMALGLAGMYL